MNCINIIGRLATDVDVKKSNGKLIAKFNIAVPNEQNKEQTYFFAVVAFEKTAEFAEKFLEKGAQVGITGKLSSSEFKDDKGNNRKTHSIIANQFTFAEKKK